MDAYEKIEEIIAKEYGSSTTTRKAIGDFMLSDTEAVNVKSNNIHKNNYSPNIMSADKAWKWLSKGNSLYFIFVDYSLDDGKVVIKEKTDLIPIEHISWDCLNIRCQGRGVIQRTKSLIVDNKQTLEDWKQGLSKEYSTYIAKERQKLAELERAYCI